MKRFDEGKEEDEMEYSRKEEGEDGREFMESKASRMKSAMLPTESPLPSSVRSSRHRESRCPAPCHALSVFAYQKEQRLVSGRVSSPREQGRAYLHAPARRPVTTAFGRRLGGQSCMHF